MKTLHVYFWRTLIYTKLKLLQVTLHMEARREEHYVCDNQKNCKICGERNVRNVIFCAFGSVLKLLSFCVCTGHGE